MKVTAWIEAPREDLKWKLSLILCGAPFVGGGLRFRGRAKFGKPAETVRNLKY